MGTGATVVIAEDEADLRDLLTYTLESNGYTVEAYSDGTACWERLRDGEVPDLVLLDIMLPSINGLDVLRKIHAEDRLADVPVVFLSGRDREETIPDGVDVNEDDYITKPFSPTELRERIDRLA
ncbi:response regulator [Natronomonas halophila]|uniref:response regulator transcription factor n=1 Tax=Natronomonas halophila TaxID=2747817 RepID=UPI0015B78D20|nr:response regulator [Natronomonas halophila]QLD86037.1 response regulator [Natronomonas halophila]